jgi:hypothetical protein
MIIMQQKHKKKKTQTRFLKKIKKHKRNGHKMYLNQSIEAAKCNKKW